MGSKDTMKEKSRRPATYGTKNRVYAVNRRRRKECINRRFKLLNVQYDLNSLRNPNTSYNQPTISMARRDLDREEVTARSSGLITDLASRATWLAHHLEHINEEISQVELELILEQARGPELGSPNGNQNLILEQAQSPEIGSPNGDQNQEIGMEVEGSSQAPEHQEICMEPDKSSDAQIMDDLLTMDCNSRLFNVGGGFDFFNYDSPNGGGSFHNDVQNVQSNGDSLEGGVGIIESGWGSSQNNVQSDRVSLEGGVGIVKSGGGVI